MVPPACNACDHQHDRPLNSKCLYFKAAVEKCAESGANPDDWRLHLPEIGSIKLPAVVVKEKLTPSRSVASPITREDFINVLQENEDCKHQLAVAQR